MRPCCLCFGDNDLTAAIISTLGGASHQFIDNTVEYNKATKHTNDIHTKWINACGGHTHTSLNTAAAAEDVQKSKQAHISIAHVETQITHELPYYEHKANNMIDLHGQDNTGAS